MGLVADLAYASVQLESTMIGYQQWDDGDIRDAQNSAGIASEYSVTRSDLSSLFTIVHS